MNADPGNGARAARLQHDERFDALRAPRVRRGLVVATFLLWLSAVILLWWDFTSAFLVPGLLGVGGVVLLNRTVRHVADAPHQLLDERLVAVRNAAYRTSYRIVGVVTGLALAALSVAVDERFAWVPFDLEGHHLRALLLGFLGLGKVGPGRGADVATGPFPGAPFRTRHANLSAPGSPRVLPVGQPPAAVVGFGVHGVAMMLPR